MTRDPGRSERWFRRLLRLFPRPFRERHAESMTQLFRDQLRESKGVRAKRELWSRTLGDTLRTAPREHLRILFSDTKLALRGMGSHAILSLVAVLTLALGIGGNATLFAVVNAILLRPLPIEDDARVVRLYATRDGGPPFLSPSNPVLFEEVERNNRSFEKMVAQRFRNVTVETDEGPERVAAMGVTRGWLDVLGVTPSVGRGFTQREETLGEDARVVLVSHEFWSNRLGGDPDGVGKTDVSIDGAPYTVVGVLPRGFRFPYDNDLYLPLDLTQERDGVWGLNIQARLRPNVTLQDARAELAVLGERIDQEHGRPLNGLKLTAIPVREVLLGNRDAYVLFLLAAVGLVLLLVSVNIGNLLLARALARQGEMALRTALGASRLRQARLLLTESLTLALVGGAGGIFVTLLLRAFAPALIPGRMAYVLDEIPVDGNVIAFTVALSIFVGLLFGGIPALRATGRDLTATLKLGRASGSESGNKLSVALVVGEVALTLVVLTTVGTLIRHYAALYRAELGYDASRILLATVPLDRGPYLDPERRVSYTRTAVERLSSLPGVTASGMTSIFPSPAGNFVSEMAIEGKPIEPDAPITLNRRLVDRGFFESLDLPLLAGRWFVDGDRAGSTEVAIISRRAAERFFPGEDPIGKRLQNLRDDDESRFRIIVGVVGDVREFWTIQETLYEPYAQHAEEAVAGQASFVVRATSATDLVAGPTRDALRTTDPSLPVFDLRAAEALYRESLGDQRLSARLGGWFAGFALLMAALGVFGVTAGIVAQKRQELGLRTALGARPGDILVMILRRGVGWAAAGIAIGSVGSVGAARWLSSTVPDLEGLGILSFGAVSLLLVCVAVAACYFPARRAVAIEPLSALRSE